MKANPGKLFWSTAATNGGPHIATEAAFKHLGVSGTYVPYKGGADAIAGLLGGQIQMLVAAEFPPYAAAGQIRLLAETGPDTGVFQGRFGFSNDASNATASPQLIRVSNGDAVTVTYVDSNPPGIRTATATWKKIGRAHV